jgi:1-deoxy-D-xylulose-5-phosphate reductoisomerase
MKRVLILGSTGSIGVQALQVVASGSDLSVVGLSCATNVSLLLEQAMSLGARHVAISDASAALGVGRSLYPELKVFEGAGAAAKMVREVEADIVLNAIVGFAGLEATLAAVEMGLPVALANKESLVCAGDLVRELVDRGGGGIVPVDSEHSALFQLVGAAGAGAVESVVVTASGGPFLGWSVPELRGATREQALAHPTWSMGSKITIDSATLMNKGLEVIEAHHLFGLPYDKIDVLVHPQSIVHGLVRMIDGAVLAHMGAADMRVPIAYALRYPDRGWLGTERLDLVAAGRLDFGLPDEDTFPAIRLARGAGARGDRATCTLNAANEVAVGAFLDGRLTFLGISSLVGRVLEEAEGGRFESYEDVQFTDQWARRRADELM